MDPHLGFMIILIWFFWFFNQFIMLIILLNFLIAVISASYEKVASEHELYTYMHRAQFNAERLQIFSQFRFINHFKAIIISTEKIVLEEVDDDIQRAINRITDHHE